MASLSSHSEIPNHVAIIMDGNNRWASANKLPGVAGHQKGVERAREAVEFAVESGLKTLTLFAFFLSYLESILYATFIARIISGIFNL